MLCKGIEQYLIVDMGFIEFCSAFKESETVAPCLATFTICCNVISFPVSTISFTVNLLFFDFTFSYEPVP